MASGPEDPRTWGRVTWQSMHCIADAYPEQPSDADKAAYRNWFMSLQQVLPCRGCRDHFKENLVQAGGLTEEVLSSRYKFRNFMSTFHDCVTNSILRQREREYAAKKKAMTGKRRAPTRKRTTRRRSRRR